MKQATKGLNKKNKNKIKNLNSFNYIDNLQFIKTQFSIFFS